MRTYAQQTVSEEQARLPSDILYARELDAENVTLVGDFNEWNQFATPMKPLKDGRFKVTVELPVDRRFQFRYLINSSDWHNDWQADQYVPNPFSGENSVVEV